VDEQQDRAKVDEGKGAEEAVTTLACLDPTILHNKPDDDDDYPEMSYQRPRKYVNYGYGR
jgi:hypothetical protein